MDLGGGSGEHPVSVEEEVRGRTGGGHGLKFQN